MIPITWAKRKLDHVDLTLKLDDGPMTAGFEDVRLLHCALPGLELTDIDITTVFMGKKLSAPLIINALTGGGEELIPLNIALASAASRGNIAMAVGSQSIGIKNSELAKTFRVVRDANKKGVILANLGAGSTLKDAIEAIDMIEADGLQIHLNVPQELMMDEGDRSFSNYLANIVEIIGNVKVPVIIKEVGFGISREVAIALMANGVTNFDIGGQGGTNFIAIENKRRSENFSDYFEEWGIPTVCSLVEVASLNIPGQLVATGGIRNSMDAAKCLALGANMIGIAGAFIRISKEGSEHKLNNFIDLFKSDLKKILLMTGARNLRQLQQKPLVLTGFCRQWLNDRGIKTNEFAQR